MSAKLLAQITPSAPWGMPIMYTHYVEKLAKWSADEGWQAACGAACSDAEFSAEPTCPDCQAWLNAPADYMGRPTVDPLSHLAQTIHVASGELLDLALHAQGAESVRSLHHIAVGLRDRLSAIVEVSARHVAAPDEPCPFL